MRILLMGLFLAVFTANAQAATYNVTTTAATGVGSLHQAILDSNSPGNGTHTIAFSAAFPVNGQISLGSNLPMIGSNRLTITGGARTPRIDGQSLYSFLRLSNTTTRLELSDLTLQNGLAGGSGGGCIHVNSTNQQSAVLIATRVTISNCKVSGTNLVRGGGIYWASTGGSVSLVDSQMIGNTATATANVGEANGGAVFTTTNFSSLRTLFEGNGTASANGGGTGGALYLGGTGTFHAITESTFRFNGASPGSPNFGYGGAMHIGCMTCSTQVVRSYLRGNSANYGGAIFARRSQETTIDVYLSLVNSTFYNSSVLEQGGAVLMNSGTSLSASNNTFYNADATAGAHLAFISTPEVSFFRANLLAPTVFGTACTGAFSLPTPGFVNVNLFSDTSCSSLAAGALPNTPLGSVTVDERPGEIGVLRFSGSAVVDSISTDSLCEPRDARFQLRPQDGDGDGLARCDVGAYESPYDIIFLSGFEA